MELRRILHVDDDEDIRAVTRVTLEVVGQFDVFQCASGHDAIECAEDVRPDLILLDVMMPGIDGEQTFYKLREIDALKDVPIVFATAKVHDDALKHLRSIGAAGIVSKPFDPIVLPETIREIWVRSKENNIL